MDTKEQALEKAVEFFKTVEHKEGELINSRGVYRVIWATEHEADCDVCKEFPYAPNKPIPPKGVIIEVWSDNDPYKMTGYSCGELDENGFLLISYSNINIEPEDAITKEQYWRIIETNQKLVDTKLLFEDGSSSVYCQECINYYISQTKEPCLSCKTIRPTNFEQKIENEE